MEVKIEEIQEELNKLEMQLIIAIARGRLCAGCLNRYEECTCNQEAEHASVPRL